MQRLHARACGLLCIAGAVLFLAGCGGPGTVSGKVSLNGKTLPGGLVTIVDVDGQSRTGGIGKDGSYSVSNVAPGKAQVSVLTMSERPSVMGDGAKDSLGEYVPIPAKYMDYNHSGLALEIKSGKQAFDIQMTGEVN
jgi:hypothetical protein